MRDSDPEVSVLMISYNHASFIEEAIDSVLAQQTTFPYEIVIYDDKSGDSSRSIIRQYAEKHPELIRTILPEENQYSKGRSPLCDFLIPAARGRYLAELECDDCWTDPGKLQSQYELMEASKDIALCAHSAELFNQEKGVVEGVSNPNDEIIEITTEDIIDRGGAALATCSFFYRTDDLVDYPAWKPADCPVGDWPLMLFLSVKGKVVCLPNIMGRYRVAVSSSWTGRRSSDLKAAAVFDGRMIDMVYELSKKMPERYGLALSKKAAVYIYDLAFRSGESVSCLMKRYRFSPRSLSFREKRILSIKLVVKRVLRKFGLLSLSERAMLRFASR